MRKKINTLLQKKYILIYMILIFFVSVFLYFLNKKAIPIIMNYASVQTKKVGMEVLRNTGLTDINKKINKKEMFITEKNNNGEIESIDFNTSVLNETLIITARNVRKKLKEVEQGKNLPDEIYHGNLNKNLKKGIIYQVPLGVVFNNSFISELGPKIPVKIEYSGNVGLDLKTRVKEYGINSALIEVYIYVEVTQRTILPFQSKDVKLISEIPIILKVVKGSVPNYLSGTNGSYSLPIN